MPCFFFSIYSARCLAALLIVITVQKRRKNYIHVTVNFIRNGSKIIFFSAKIFCRIVDEHKKALCRQKSHFPALKSAAKQKRDRERKIERPSAGTRETKRDRATDRKKKSLNEKRDFNERPK